LPAALAAKVRSVSDETRRPPTDDTPEPWSIDVRDEPWAPSAIRDERRRREQFAEEMRPLIDSLRRLRERGLLD
jgi:hypothetical protein